MMAVVLVGCGDDEEGAPEDEPQPAPEVTEFSQGLFDEIPLPPGSHEIGPREETDGTVTATWTTTDVTPEQVMEFYERELPPLGWDLLEDAREIGNGIWQSDWARENRRLEVVASFAEEAAQAAPGEAKGSQMQFSLILSPDLEENPFDPPTSPTTASRGPTTSP